MDCRRTLCLAAVLLAGAAGCDSKTFPLWPSAANDPAHPPEPPKIANVDLTFAEVKDLKPATLVAYAGLKENEVAKTAAEAQANREEVQKAYVRALKIDPKYVPAHLGLARSQEAQDHHDRALASYREVLKLAPTDPKNWIEVGMCHARHKEWKKAITHLRKANELEPDNRQCARALGLCLARSGQPDDALLCLMRVENEAQAHYLVARMMHHMNQDEVSKRYARQALVADPKLDGARKLLAELEGGNNLDRTGTSVTVFETDDQ